MAIQAEQLQEYAFWFAEIEFDNVCKCIWRNAKSRFSEGYYQGNQKSIKSKISAFFKVYETPTNQLSYSYYEGIPSY